MSKETNWHCTGSLTQPVHGLGDSYWAFSAREPVRGSFVEAMLVANEVVVTKVDGPLTNHELVRLTASLDAALGQDDRGTDEMWDYVTWDAKLVTVRNTGGDNLRHTVSNVTGKDSVRADFG